MGTATIDEAVTSVTFTADGAGLAPHEFAVFNLLLGPVPDVDSLTFGAVQTYADGEVVSWTDPIPADGEEPEHPAPVLTVSGATADGHGHGGDGTHSDGDGHRRRHEHSDGGERRRHRHHRAGAGRRRHRRRPGRYRRRRIGGPDPAAAARRAAAPHERPAPVGPRGPGRSDVGVLGLVGAGPAWAHNALTNSDPADGASTGHLTGVGDADLQRHGAEPGTADHRRRSGRATVGRVRPSPRSTTPSACRFAPWAKPVPTRWPTGSCRPTATRGGHHDLHADRGGRRHTEPGDPPTHALHRIGSRPGSGRWRRRWWWSWWRSAA